MAVTWRQWIDGFDSTQTETSCTVTVDAAAAAPDKNKLTATIHSAADTEDHAVAIVSSHLPAGNEGRLRFKFRTPATFNLLGNSTILLLVNSGGQHIIDLFLSSGEQLNLFTTAGVLDSAGGTLVGTTSLVANTEYTIEIAWRQNSYRKVWLNGTLILSGTGLTGATLSAVPASASFGIDHYDGGDSAGWTAVDRQAQIADNADTALQDPQTITGGVARATAAARGGALSFAGAANHTQVNGGVARATATAKGGHLVQSGAATISADRLLNPGPNFARLLWSTVYGDHQEAYYTVDAGSGFNEWDIFLRFGEATLSGYMAEYEDDTLNVNVYRVDNGAFTQIKSIHLAQRFVAGDVFGFDASGSTLTVYVNGVAQGNVTDSKYTQGQLGVGLSAGHALDNFGGGGDSVPGATGILGNTNAGATWRTPGPPAENALHKVTVPAGKTYRVTAMNMYGRGNATAGTADWKFVVFDATGANGEPGVVVGIVGVATLTGGATPTPEGWVRVPAGTTIDLDGGAAGTDYWLGGIWGGTASADYSNTGAGEAYYAVDETDSYDTIAVGDAFGTPTSDPYNFSAYIEWEDVTATAPRVYGGVARATATAKGGALSGGTPRVHGGLVKAKATAYGAALSGGETVTLTQNATREWGFAIVDGTGVIQAVIEPRDVAVTVPLNDYSSAKGTLRTLDDLAAYLSPVSAVLKVWVDGVLRFHGAVAEPLEGQVQNTNFVAADPWFGLGKRLVQLNPDGTEVPYTNEDAGAVLWGLVTQQEARKPTHLAQGTITASTSISGTHSEGQTVADDASAIVQMDGAPFFRVDPVDGVAGTYGELNVAPTAGRTLENVRLEFGDETLGNIADDFQVQYAVPATAIKATGGQDANGNTITSYAEADAAVIDQYGLNEKPLSFPDVTDQAHLDALALAHVQTKPPATYTVNTLWTGGDVWVPRLWAEFDRGDTIRLRIRYGWLDVDALVRVNSATVELDNESRQERVTNLVLEEV